MAVTMFTISDSFTAANGTAPDSSKWTIDTFGSSSTLNVQSNAMHFVTTNGGYSGQGLNSTMDSSTKDQSIVLKFLPGSSPNTYLEIGVRRTYLGTPGWDSGYSVWYDPTINSFHFDKTTAVGVSTALGSTVALANPTTSWTWVRIDATGSNIRWRQWLDGNAEPTTWDQSVIDTTYTTGICDVKPYGDNAATTYTIDFDEVTIFAQSGYSSGTGAAQNATKSIKPNAGSSATGAAYNPLAVPARIIAAPLATATAAKMYVPTLNLFVNFTVPNPASANGAMLWDGSVHIFTSSAKSLSAVFNVPEVRDRLWVSTVTASMVPTVLGSGQVSFVAHTDMTVLGKATANGAVNLTANTSMILGNLNQIQSPESLSTEIIDITQHVIPRITATWATSRFMDNLVLTATNDGVVSTDVPAANDYFIPAQAANGWNEATFKWCVTDALGVDGAVIRCDEDYVTMDSLEDEKSMLEMGWWSKSLSASNGTFGTSQVLQFEFDTRKANYLRVTSSDVYGPINQYKIYYKNTSNTWVQFGGTQTLSGYRDEYDLGSVIDVKGIKIEVLSTLYGNDAARIQELEPVYRTDVDPNDVVSLEVKKVKESYDTTVPMGALAANSFDLVLDNTALVYNTTSGALAPYLVKDVQFDVDLGWDTGSQIFYVHQGTFYAEDAWSEDGDAMTVSVSCRDFSKFLQEGDQLEYGYLLKNSSASAAIQYLALTANVPRNRILLHSAGDTFAYLFDKDVSIWDAMLNVATADVGLFFFDEYEKLNYYTQEDIYNNVSTIAHSLSDDTNIIGGNIVHNLQANKVVVKIQPVSIDNTGLQEVWRAPDGSSLAVTQLSGSISSSDTSITSTSATTLDFNTNGYIKIDNEIIKYTTLVNNVYGGLTRGVFGTLPASHTSGVKIKETRQYNIDFDTAPVDNAKYPYISQQIFFNKVDVERYVRTAYSADLIISASDNVAVDEIILLEGTQSEPVDGVETDLNFIFAIAGIPISLPEAKDKVTEETRTNNSAIRRFGKKDLTIDNPFIQTQEYARTLAQFLIDKFEDAAQIVNMSLLCIPQVTMSDIIRVTDYAQLNLTNKDFFVIESNIHYDGGLSHEVVLKEVT